MIKYIIGKFSIAFLLFCSRHFNKVDVFKHNYISLCANINCELSAKLLFSQEQSRLKYTFRDLLIMLASENVIKIWAD